MNPARTDLDPPSGQCLIFDGAKSYMPDTGGREETGSFCYLAFDDDKCDCIKNARLIVIDPARTRVDCETQEVADRHSYHFEREDPDVSL